jgi:hypothetical protein
MRAKNCVFLVVAIALGLSVLGPGVAFGTVIASDSFDYAAGGLAVNNGGTGWSGTWTQTAGFYNPSVVSPGLTYTGVACAGNATQMTTNTTGASADRSFATIGSSNESIWISFLVQGVFPVDSGKWGGVGLLNSSGSLVERISGYGGTWRLYDADGGFHTSNVATDGTIHLITENIQFGAGSDGNDVINVWFDPSTSTPGVAPSVASATTTAQVTHNPISGIHIEGDFAANFDEIRVGTTFADSIGQAVPEPSTCILCATGLIGLLAYAWRKRR